jgi:hypothetical protein
VLLRATLAAAHATRPVRTFLPRSGRGAALLDSAPFPARRFCGLSALLGTRRRGRALRRAGLPAAGFAALRLRRFTAPFGRGTGLTFRASALGAPDVPSCLRSSAELGVPGRCGCCA